MNSQNDKDGSNTRAAVITGIFAVMAACIGGIFLVIIAFINNGFIFAGAGNQNPYPTTAPISTQPVSVSTLPVISGNCQESGGQSLSSLPSTPSNGCVLIVEWSITTDANNCGVLITSSTPDIPNNAIGTWWNVYPTRPESHVQEFLQKYPHCKIDDQR